jgi:histone H3/H4
MSPPYKHTATHALAEWIEAALRKNDTFVFDKGAKNELMRACVQHCIDLVSSAMESTALAGKSTITGRDVRLARRIITRSGSK